MTTYVGHDALLDEGCVCLNLLNSETQVRNAMDKICRPLLRMDYISLISVLHAFYTDDVTTVHFMTLDTTCSQF